MKETFGAVSWRSFLRAWNDEFMGDALQRERAMRSPTVSAGIKRSWLGFSPASEAEIAKTEARLGSRLPEDMRAFYQVTNGWIAPGFTTFGYAVVPVERLERYRIAYPDSFALIEESEGLDFTSEKGAKPRHVSPAALGTGLAISDHDLSALLLVNVAEGAGWLIDFQRQNWEFSSFSAMMVFVREDTTNALLPPSV